MKHLAGVFLVSVALAAGSAAAQDQRLQVEQISSAPPPAAAAPVQQVAPESRHILAPPPAPRTTAPPQQLSTGAESAPDTRQLTREDKAAPAPAQLYHGGPTAQPSAPLSSPAEGRTGAIAKVEGHDRCDSARDKDKKNPQVCANVIETRSAEFARPDPAALSPEQRIMAEQRLREASPSLQTVVRRLANNEGDPDSIEAQSVASVVLNRPAEPAPKKPEEPAENASTDAAAALVAAIINATNGQQQPPPQ